MDCLKWKISNLSLFFSFLKSLQKPLTKVRQPIGLINTIVVKTVQGPPLVQKQMPDFPLIVNPCHLPVKVSVMLIQARGYHLPSCPSAVEGSDWWGIHSRIPSQVFASHLLLISKVLLWVLLEGRVWDKDLDAVGLLWEVMGVWRRMVNGRKENQPKGCFLSWSSLWAPGAWSYWESFESCVQCASKLSELSDTEETIDSLAVLLSGKKLPLLSFNSLMHPSLCLCQNSWVGSVGIPSAGGREDLVQKNKRCSMHLGQGHDRA